ncbi:MAG: ATP-binding protein [Actinobacteria bacterium]|nr:ATP-binding protein [Actinomycetota bacterium]
MLTRRGAFFGRSELLDRLLHVFREIADEQRRGIVAVTGEPGAGKSRLVAELAIRLRANVRFGRCDRNRATPYEPFLQSFEELSSVLLDPAATDADRYGLFETADQQLCDRKPLLLVIDDLQWADEATLLLLRHIARHGERSTLLIAATLRDEPGLGQRVRSFLVDMSREQVLEQLHVPRLDQAATLSLVRSPMTGTMDPTIQDAIVERAGGNPFFLHELADHATEKRRT